MHKCLLTYRDGDNEKKETYLYYKNNITEALKKFFIFNDRKSIKVIALQTKKHYPDDVDIEEKEFTIGEIAKILNELD